MIRHCMNKRIVLCAALPLLLNCGGSIPRNTTKPEAQTVAAVQPANTPDANVPLSAINLADIGHIAPKGRVQDREYNQLPVVEQLLAHGKEAIPYLIAHLEDETKIKGHVIDYWSEVRVGDVAHIILSDFFTDSTWQHMTIAGVNWNELLGSNANLTGEQRWRNYIAKHGRKSIRAKWQQLWDENKENIFWDESERCFKVTKQ
ncbi:MAG: hypothetical protein DMF64_13100 [Acidobacteria bacterium]|nr:MAG: hypothetical protein DMF64_13100 [Acidobacteriota bacterium]